MYQYIFDDQTTNTVKDSTKKSKTLLEQFSEVDNKYNSLSSSNASLNLEKMEFTKPTDEQVKTKAENSLADFKSSEMESINSSYDTKAQSIDKSIEDAKTSAKTQKENIVNTYASAKEDAKNDAIKRGLARSSIVVNTLANYDTGMLESLKQKEAELGEKISGFESEKQLLEQQKSNALNSFDIEYAVKLQNKIDELNQEISKQEKEVIKYNNQIAEIEAEWKKKQEDNAFDKISELAGLMDEYGIYVFDVLKQNDKYALAQNYFKALNKQEALAELQNNAEYKSSLGAYNYNKLLEEINSREN